MLRFTKQLDYGLMAMRYTTERQGDATVGVRRIADEFGIPAELLAKVLQRLAKRGLLTGQTGPRGGYRLTLPLTAVTAVTVGQVLRALEGPVAIVSCLRDHGECAQASGCTLRKPARKLQAAVTNVLDTMTLAELGDADVPAALVAK